MRRFLTLACMAVISTGAVRAQNVSTSTLHVADGHLMLPEHWISTTVQAQDGIIVPFTLGGIPLQQIALVGLSVEGHVSLARRFGWVDGDLEAWSFLGDTTSFYVAAHAAMDAMGYAMLIKLDASLNVLWTRAFPTTSGDGGAGMGADGRIVLFSGDGTFVRFNADGSHDLALHCPGLDGVAIRTDGRIMLAHGDLAALAPDGSLLWNSASEEWSLDLKVLASPDGGFVTAQYALGFGIDTWIFQRHSANDSLAAKTSVSHSPDWYDVRQLEMRPDGMVRVAGVRADDGDFPALKCFDLHPDGSVTRELGNAACLTAGVRSIALPGDRSVLMHHTTSDLDPVMLVLPDTTGSTTCEVGPTFIPASVWTELDPWFASAPYSVTAITPQIIDTLTIDAAPLLVEPEMTCAQWTGIGEPVVDISSPVFPVPAGDRLFIASSAGVRPTDRVIVRALAGTTLYDGPYGDGVDVSSAAPGVYVLELGPGLRACVVIAR